MIADFLLSEAMEVGGLHLESEEESEEEEEVEAVGEEEEVEAVDEEEEAVLSTEAAMPVPPRTYKRPRRVLPNRGLPGNSTAQAVGAVSPAHHGG